MIDHSNGRNTIKTYKISYRLDGIVQGVGFRPAIYRLAAANKLGGEVKNCGGYVELQLIGDEAQISKFWTDFNSHLPPNASVSQINELQKQTFTGSWGKFEIADSTTSEIKTRQIPADLAMCKDCQQEISTPSNRRYNYPFTTCTNCGPRYTVINDMPYDRKRTTLNQFPLCEKCEKEYKNPTNRRFHAESTACATCGPQLFLTDKTGKKLEVPDTLTHTSQEIASGKIIALRGIGGYQLVVDAFNAESITLLRQRKQRPSQPFAVMMKDISKVEKHCELSNAERDLLTSPASPIVILKIKKNNNIQLPKAISPDTQTIGVMLPYTPLHTLLFEQEATPLVLIVTSGNLHNEPICIKNEEAFQRLASIADIFLCHNREINCRCDDSLAIIQMDKKQIWRRARGYAPEPIHIKSPFPKTVLGMGAFFKNSICIGQNELLFPGAHIGDLSTPEAVDAYTEDVDRLCKFLDITPQIIATDLHPNFYSTQLGERLAKEKGFDLVKVQHHHAHAAACMAEHNLREAIAVVFDGTGLGTDNTIWGAEVLYVTPEGFKRMATFQPSPLPGGDYAVKDPRRQLVARLTEANIEKQPDFLNYLSITEEEWHVWSKQTKQALNAPLSHAAGRLFDAVSLLLGAHSGPVDYEGQAAIKLETLATRSKSNSLPELNFAQTIDNNILHINWQPIFSDIQCYNKLKPEDFALAFHQTTALAIKEMVNFAFSHHNTKNIVLSGGCFMNQLLTQFASQELTSLGGVVHLHHKIPPNDGGISTGQVFASGISSTIKL